MTREPDWEELRDAAIERRQKRQGCACDPGGEMPGHCPGRSNCPYSGDCENETDETEEDES